MTLSVVATPIGNLSDITLRAKEVLTRATLIIAEDTRTARKLLQLLDIGIDKEFVSSHAQSSEHALRHAIARCETHDFIALVTDAGTPTISDPGSLFVDTFRNTYSDATVEPIPGPAAAIAALSVSGFPSSHFEFMGFIPHKKGRETFLKTVANTDHTVVFYESPHRVLKTLESMAKLFNGRQIMIGREMTKQFEEYPRGTAQELFAYYQERQDKVRGEFVIVVSPHSAARTKMVE